MIRGLMAWFVLLLIVSGCSGIEPYTPTNHRVEGPESGLFSGSEGGFVIYQKGEKSSAEKKDRERGKEAETTTLQNGD